MEANAPEKIFICDYGSELGFEWHSESDWEHQGLNDIEYTRTDAFIEKACRFIKERLFFEDSWHVEGEASILDKVIEDFKNYMKGE